MTARNIKGLRSARQSFANPRWKDLDAGFVASTEDYVRSAIDFYDSRAQWHRRFYRVAGVVTILGGSSLPLLTILTFTGKNIAIATVGCLVAVATAMKAFYRWDTSWVLLRRTEIELTRAYARYVAQRGPRGARDDVLTPTSAAGTLLEAAFRIREEEALEFFRDLARHDEPAAPRPPGENRDVSVLGFVSQTSVGEADTSAV